MLKLLVAMEIQLMDACTCFVCSALVWLILCILQIWNWSVMDPCVPTNPENRFHTSQCHPDLFFQHQPAQYQDVHLILLLVTWNRANQSSSNQSSSNFYAIELRKKMWPTRSYRMGDWLGYRRLRWLFIPVLCHLITILSFPSHNQLSVGVIQLLSSS